MCACTGRIRLVLAHRTRHMCCMYAIAGPKWSRNTHSCANSSVLRMSVWRARCAVQTERERESVHVCIKRAIDLNESNSWTVTERSCRVDANKLPGIKFNCIFDFTFSFMHGRLSGQYAVNEIVGNKVHYGKRSIGIHNGRVKWDIWIAFSHEGPIFIWLSADHPRMGGELSSCMHILTEWHCPQQIHNIHVVICGPIGHYPWPNTGKWFHKLYCNLTSDQLPPQISSTARFN